jgi:hypothetical protein
MFTDDSKDPSALIFSQASQENIVGLLDTLGKTPLEIQTIPGETSIV